MELEQFHTFERMSEGLVAGELERRVAPGHLHPRADVGLVVAGPWRPADLWGGGLERLAWSVTVESGGGPMLSEAGEEALGRHGIARRKAPVHLVEVLAEALGEGLVLVHSDAAKLAYVAVYRQRRLAWSLLLQDRVRLVRCDGASVQVTEPPRFVAEGDRMGVLLAGLRQWLREPVPIAEEDRFTLVETLAALTEGEPQWIVRAGRWQGSGTPARAFG